MNAINKLFCEIGGLSFHSFPDYSGGGGVALKSMAVLDLPV